MTARFTLVELMVVIAIVAVLAAIGVPMFAQYSMRAKTAEAFVNVDGIATAAAATASETGGVFNTLLNPSVDPDKELHPWETQAAWQALGWAADGDVRCQYQAGVDGRAGLPPRAVSTGACDVDADGDRLCVACRHLDARGPRTCESFCKSADCDCDGTPVSHRTDLGEPCTK